MTETVSLTEEQAAFARSLVEDGRYASVSAVVREGMDLLREQAAADPWDPENMDPEDAAMLKELLTERAKGPFISGEEMDRRLEKMMKEKRREYLREG